MGLDNAYGVGSLKPGVCTSSTRPASPYEGQTIYETDTDLVKSYNGSSWVTIGPTTIPTAAITAFGSARVDTSQTTTSTSYTDLTTSGPAVTLTTGTSALVIVGARISIAALSSSCYMSYAVSGSSTVSATDGRSVNSTSPGGEHESGKQMSYASVITGLTAGSNTFTAKYRVSGNTGTFSERQIIVMAL
jgi:hypothetical protein